MLKVIVIIYYNFLFVKTYLCLVLALAIFAAQPLGHRSNRGMGQAAPNRATAARAYRSQCLLPPKKFFEHPFFLFGNLFCKRFSGKISLTKQILSSLNISPKFSSKGKIQTLKTIFPQFHSKLNKFYQNTKMPLEIFFSRGNKHCLRYTLAT